MCGVEATCMARVRLQPRTHEASPSPGAMMIFNNQHRSYVVTPPRSEGSLSMGTEMLRCAQHDSTGFGC